MRRILMSAAAAAAVLLAGSMRSPEATAARAPGAPGASLDELLSADCTDGTAAAAAQEAARLPQEGGVASDEWPPHAIGGVIPPIRSVSDPFPTFDGVAQTTEAKAV